MMLKGEGDALAHEPQCPIRPEDLTHIYAKIKIASSPNRSKKKMESRDENTSRGQGKEFKWD